MSVVTPPEKNIKWNCAGLLLPEQGEERKKKIPNPQTQMVSQGRGILVKGNEDTPRRYHST